MRSTILYVTILLLLLTGCTFNKPRTADIHVPPDYIEHEALSSIPDLEGLPTSVEATVIPSPSHTIDERVESAKLLWISMEGELLHKLEVSRASLIESVRTEQSTHSLLIHNQQSVQLQLINMNTREVKEVAAPSLPDATDIFYNDYGAMMLFAGQLNSEIELVIFGNKIVYIYNELGEPNPIYVASKPIYGSALSENKQLLALLIASDDFIGAEADLIVIDLQGKVVYEAERISYIGHSDGFHFLYPMEWTNEHTVAVPLLGSGDFPFHRGYALVNIDENSLQLESEPILSDEAFMLLKNHLNDLHPNDILSVHVMPSNKTVAVNTSRQTQEIWLLDVEEQTVSLLTEGLLIDWNEQQELIVLQSSSISPYFTKLNLNGF